MELAYSGKGIRPAFVHHWKLDVGLNKNLIYLTIPFLRLPIQSAAGAISFRFLFLLCLDFFNQFRHLFILFLAQLHK